MLGQTVCLLIMHSIGRTGSVAHIVFLVVVLRNTFIVLWSKDATNSRRTIFDALSFHDTGTSPSSYVQQVGGPRNTEKQKKEAAPK